MNDRCCSRCRNPFVCAKGHQCDCHAQYAREQRARDTWRDLQEREARRAREASEASDARSKEIEGFKPWR